MQIFVVQSNRNENITGNTMSNDQNVFEQIAELVKQGKLDQQCYPVGFIITQSGNFLVKHTNSTVVLVKTFTEVEKTFEKFVTSLNHTGV